MAPRIELFAFRYRGPRTGKWQHARYKAERHVIAERYPEGWEITGEPMVIEANREWHGYSQPGPPRKRQPPPTEDPAALSDLERFLLAVFLRRYVAYCARRGRYAAMNGAARLFAEIRTSAG
jgi:hypothetical protein